MPRQRLRHRESWSGRDVISAFNSSNCPGNWGRFRSFILNFNDRGCYCCLCITVFCSGEALPVPISPAAVALLGAALALLLAYQSKIDTVNNILRDVDWSTLIFFMSTFVMWSLEGIGWRSLLCSVAQRGWVLGERSHDI